MATIADINTECRDLCSADTTDYSAALLLIRINHAYETVVGWILNADGRWQFDDNNFTTFPEATTTLVSGQKDYQFDSSQLKVLAVEVLDANGNYYPLTPIDKTDIRDGFYAISEYQKTAGQPNEYDVDGSSIVLYPPPDNGVSVTLAAGLKVYYQRTADIFTSSQVTTGTKQPGFASPFHMILAYMAAIPYCVKFHPSRVQNYEIQVAKMRSELEKFYNKRDKDEAPTMTMKGNWKRK